MRVRAGAGEIGICVAGELAVPVHGCFTDRRIKAARPAHGV